jgi:hypothetical protein
MQLVELNGTGDQAGPAPKKGEPVLYVLEAEVYAKAGD